MITITQAVSQLILQDELASEALREDLLNLSAYADKIHKRVENLTFKDVKRGTIVVALTRIKKNLAKLPPLYPEIEINNLSVKSSLYAFTYEKTLDIQRKIAVLHPFLLPMNDLFSITEGPSEVTIVFAEKSEELIKKHFSTRPKVEFRDIVAVTVQFRMEVARIPNFFYGLFSTLAGKRINIIEIVSTFTEISFIVGKDAMEETMKSLNVYFIKKNKKHEK